MRIYKMKSTSVVLAAASVFLAMGASAALASAASQNAVCGSPGSVCFFSGNFTGETVAYPDASDSCTTLPFTAHAVFNATDKGIDLYTDADCNDFIRHEPANNFHSFLTRDVRSYRASTGD
ncbi:peptidase inhibitor family I36 protein [Sorangium sp. So ce341]|uniref:peptidase inhibitor family I36 protein n=1 Tax=Sorangium sp. So ce341 TaxID=3133302 RepID=UPI003F640AE1